MQRSKERNAYKSNNDRINGMCDEEKFPFAKKLVDECDTYWNNSKVNRIEAICKRNHLVRVAPQVKKFAEFIYQTDYVKADKKKRAA